MNDFFASGYEAAIENVEEMVAAYLPQVYDNRGKKALSNLTDTLRRSLPIAKEKGIRPVLFMFETFGGGE